MNNGTQVVGRSVDDVCEGHAGTLLHRAIVLSDLSRAAYGAAEEFIYEETDLGTEIATKCREIEALVERLSLDEHGLLTLNRECRRCSGNGKTTGEDPCIECDGSGYVHADEADG